MPYCASSSIPGYSIGWPLSSEPLIDATRAADQRAAYTWQAARRPRRRQRQKGRRQSRAPSACCRPCRWAASVLGTAVRARARPKRPSRAGPSQDAGEGVQPVHGHIVERAAPWLAEIPGRIDVGQRVACRRARRLRLRGTSQMLRRSTAQVRRPSAPSSISCLIFWCARTQHLARRGDQLDAPGAWQLRSGGRPPSTVVVMLLLKCTCTAGCHGCHALFVVQGDGRTE